MNQTGYIELYFVEGTLCSSSSNVSFSKRNGIDSKCLFHPRKRHSKLVSILCTRCNSQIMYPNSEQTGKEDTQRKMHFIFFVVVKWCFLRAGCWYGLISTNNAFRSVRLVKTHILIYFQNLDFNEILELWVSEKFLRPYRNF